MPKQIAALGKRGSIGPGLDERIARLRRRRTALVQLMDSLVAYSHYAGQESDLTYACHLHNPMRNPMHNPMHCPTQAIAGRSGLREIGVDAPARE